MVISKGVDPSRNLTSWGPSIPGEPKQKIWFRTYTYHYVQCIILNMFKSNWRVTYKPSLIRANPRSHEPLRLKSIAHTREPKAYCLNKHKKTISTHISIMEVIISIKTRLYNIIFLNIPKRSINEINKGNNNSIIIWAKPKTCKSSW